MEPEMPCGPDPCGAHHVVNCGACPPNGAIARGVFWTPISIVNRLFNYGYYPEGGCGQLYIGECDRACSSCDVEGNYVGGAPCGVGCAPAPATGTCLVNYAAGPCNNMECASSTRIFGDKLSPSFAETQMNYQFRPAPLRRPFIFGLRRHPMGYYGAPYMMESPMMQYAPDGAYEYMEEGEIVMEGVEHVSVQKPAIPGKQAPKARPVADEQQQQVVVQSKKLPQGLPNAKQTLSQRQVASRLPSANQQRYEPTPVVTAEGTVARKPSQEDIATVGAKELPPQKQVITSAGAKFVPVR